MLGLSLGGARAASTPGGLPANWIKGVNMIGYGPDPYKVDNQHDAMASWKATGGNAIAFAPRWFMDVAPARRPWRPDPTLGLAVRRFVGRRDREAHRQGLRVMLRPYLDVKDGTWRGPTSRPATRRLVRELHGLHEPLSGYRQATGVEEFTWASRSINMTQPRIYDSDWRR